MPDDGNWKKNPEKNKQMQPWKNVPIKFHGIQLGIA